jgi:chromate reductase, NAD(P)H dehydrogenase (quinone)
LFDANGQIGAHSKTFMQAWVDQYIAWVVRHAR